MAPHQIISGEVYYYELPDIEDDIGDATLVTVNFELSDDANDFIYYDSSDKSLNIDSGDYIIESGET